MSRFHTGRGDDGTTTRLGGGGRLPKDAPVMEAVGAVDELMGALGLVRVHLEDGAAREVVRQVQGHLQRLMAHLSATEAARRVHVGLGAEEVAWLESVIEGWEAALPPVRGFVLPGASLAEAACHLARAVARRAERRVVALAASEAGVNPPNLAYLNRLSSLLFVLALRERARAT